ncbi:hypothetical protein [Telmatospirillum sp.]|uniref:hypothetical protein n=1 Tax=Telmatospirillum sp. TaxID=2079197 RepID=UPI002841BBA6|nr:hypothetical protein [Telmatospirillum sp.]MDR3440335.1 hypothetical protein [Telmatospirillum sp.]
MSVDADSRSLSFEAFLSALQDAFAIRSSRAKLDFTPDPKAVRFPPFEAPAAGPAARKPATLTGPVEDWWKEASATGRKLSTYESYRNTMAAFRAFLKHDDAGRVTPEDVIRFKDFRLASKNSVTGKPISAKTVKDSDLSALKAVFGWALSNRKIALNPAEGVTLKVGKKAKLRERSLSDVEALDLLKAATALKPGTESPATAAAKRWVPWLQAYSGARVAHRIEEAGAGVFHQMSAVGDLGSSRQRLGTLPVPTTWESLGHAPQWKYRGALTALIASFRREIAVRAYSPPGPSATGTGYR